MFLEGVIHQLEAFAMSAGVQRNDVYVKLTFADGESVVLPGLRICEPYAASDWGMVQGVGATVRSAVVIREDNILKIEFNLASTRNAPIGFVAEDRP